MSERLGNHELKTLDMLPSATFHLLSYPEQFVVLQNTALEMTDGAEFTKPLNLNDITHEEIEAVHRLLSNEYYVGPFASTCYEGKYAWRNYLDSTVKETNDLFEMATTHNLWMKYVGLADYDVDLMSQFVHSLNLTCEGYFGHGDYREMMSPARVIPAYAKALENEGHFDNSVVLGAFSLKSVADIWAIKKHLLKGDSNLGIIDLYGFLNSRAAKHYGIPFLEKDALETGFSDGSQNLVMTNCLTTSLEVSGGSGISHLVQARKALFTEIGRITAKGAKLLMIEYPLVVMRNYEYDKQELSADLRLIESDLTNSCFTDIQIEQAQLLPSRVEQDTFIKTGKIDQSKVSGPDWRQAYLITAKKK